MDSDANQLRESVRQAYSAAAIQPHGKHPFPIGRGFAASVGYPERLLDGLPIASVEHFAGVSHVAIFADIRPGSTVLDIGCGSGMDSLIAAQRAGRVIGVDFSEAMLQRAGAALQTAGHPNILFVQSAAERLPLADASVDHGLANGIFNLNPYREQIVAELARVLKPGATLFGAELVLAAPLEESARRGSSNWFSWLAGARESVAFCDEFHRAGFRTIRFLRTLRNARTSHPAVRAAEFIAIL